MKQSAFLLFILLSFQVQAQSLPTYYNTLVKNSGLKITEQAFCLQDSSGMMFEHQATKTMKPASVTKLYVTDWALSKIGSEYRYKTKFSLNGKILSIKGGEDPFFVTESIMAIANHLNQIGVKELDEVIFDQHFFLNWSDDPATIKSLLVKYLNPKTWNQQTKLELRNFRRSMKIPAISTLKVNFVRQMDQNNFEQGETFTLSSSPLYKHIKQMNVFSTNFYAQKLFDHLGGVNAFHSYMLTTYGATEKEIKFYTGSGLGENYTTCALTLKLIDHLQEKIQELNLRLEDVVSVAGSDEGTLAKRFTEAPFNKSVIAKTGTLNDTTTLAGYLYTNEGIKHFAILNHTKDAEAGRKLQNELVKKLLSENFTASPGDYVRILYSPLDDVTIE